MEETAMEAHYNGHTIRITPIPIGTKDIWTFSALVVWGEGLQRRTKLFIRHGCHFSSENEALKRALEIVSMWTNRGMDVSVLLFSSLG
jgi:hypothetical protein